MNSDELWDEDHVQVDDLAVGLTRPATIGGVPMKPFMIGMLIGMVVFLESANPLYLLIDIPIYGGLRLISATYPRIFAEIMAWLRVNARCNNRVFWGVASFSPRRTVKWGKR